MAPALTETAGQAQKLKLPYAPPLPSTIVRSHKGGDCYTTLADKGLIKVIRRFPAAPVNGFGRSSSARKPTPEGAPGPQPGRPNGRHGVNSLASRPQSTTMNGGRSVAETQHSQVADEGKRSADMGLSRVNASFMGNGDRDQIVAEVKREMEETVTPVPGNRKSMRDGAVARERYQQGLERRAERLLRRVRRLQTAQSSRHVSGQLVGLVGQQRRALNMPERVVSCGGTSAGRVDIPATGGHSSTTSASGFSGSSGLPDMRSGILQSESMRSLSTSALVNLVKKLESGAAETAPGSTSHLRGRLALSTMTDRPYGGSRTLTLAGEVRVDAPGAAGTSEALPMDPRLCSELRWTGGNLLTNLSHLEREVDSEATASSSGGESCDEDDFDAMPGQPVGDRRTKPLTFYKRASWKWAMERAGVVSRWTWLQAQVSDLEYRIRQTADIYKQIRAIKEPVVDYPKPRTVAGPRGIGLAAPSQQVNGYISAAGARPVDPAPEQLADADDEGCTSSRTCPLRPLRKRKLLRSTGLHLGGNRKAARLSSVRCTCQCPSRVCNTCCGRVNHVLPVEPERTSLNDRLSLLDPAYHPVLSFPQDACLSLHFESLLRSGDYSKLGAKGRNGATLKKKARGASQISEHARKQSRKLKKNATATLTARLRKRFSKDKRLPGQRRQYLQKKKLPNRLTNSAANAGQDRTISESSACSSKRDSPVPSPGLMENSSSQASGNSSWGSSEPKEQARKGGGILQDMLRRRRLVGSAFDINNIVIPHSMAAATRVERLQYKEIITPKWRLAVDAVVETPSGEAGEGGIAVAEDEEDVTDEMCVRRHDRCEVDERKRFMGYQLNRQPVSRRTRSATRCDSRADSSGANTPDPMSPHAPNPSDHPQQDTLNASPPPTPGGVVPADTEPALSQTPTILQQMSRRRTTSLSRRDQRATTEDGRVTSPDEMDEEHVPVAPWDPRVFPLNDDEYEAFLIEVATMAEMPEVPRLRRRRSGEAEEEDVDLPADAEWDPEVEHLPTPHPEAADPDWTPETVSLVLAAEEREVDDEVGRGPPQPPPP